MRKALRAVGGIVAVLCACAVLAYAGLWVINARDEPPSADVVAFDAQLAQRPPLADADNAYVYLLGMAAPDAVDPQQLGAQRMAFLAARAQAPATHPMTQLPGAERSSWRAMRPGPVVALAKVCQGDIAACAEALDASAEPTVDQWLTEEGWLLSRYQTLLAHRAWREYVDGDPTSLPGYTGLMDGQQLLLMQAWRKARKGDTAAADALLAADLGFWRVVLRDSDLLISKSIAASAIRRHFAFGNLVLRAGAMPAPAAWRVPFTTQERSLRRAMSGELRYVGVAVQAASAEVAMAKFDGPAERFGVRLQRPFFKPQASTNQVAARDTQLADLSELPLAQLPQALAQAGHATPQRGLVERLYNPIGKALMDVGDPVVVYAGHALRIGDLEGFRRVAVATASLRMQGAATDPNAAPPKIAERDPYTEQPLGWDAQRRMIVFDRKGLDDDPGTRIVY